MNFGLISRAARRKMPGQRCSHIPWFLPIAQPASLECCHCDNAAVLIPLCWSPSCLPPDVTTWVTLAQHQSSASPCFLNHLNRFLIYIQLCLNVPLSASCFHLILALMLPCKKGVSNHVPEPCMTKNMTQNIAGHIVRDELDLLIITSPFASAGH